MANNTDHEVVLLICQEGCPACSVMSIRISASLDVKGHDNSHPGEDKSYKV